MGRTSKKSKWTKMPVTIKRTASNGNEKTCSVSVVKLKQGNMEPKVFNVTVIEPDIKSKVFNVKAIRPHMEPKVFNVTVVQPNYDYDEGSLPKMDECSKLSY